MELGTDEDIGNEMRAVYADSSVPLDSAKSSLLILREKDVKLGFDAKKFRLYFGYSLAKWYRVLIFGRYSVDHCDTRFIQLMR